MSYSQKNDSGESDFSEKTVLLQRYVVAVGSSVIVFALITFFVIIFIYSQKFSGPLHEKQEVWGQFGDFLGGTLNPIFSLLSLIAIVTTLIIQTRELSNSTETLRKQGENFKIQAFESSFFTLIRMNNENVKHVDLEDTEPDTFVGKRAFRKLYQRLQGSYDLVKQGKKNKNDGDAIIKNAYEQFYSKNQMFIGHYFRTVQQIFGFIVDRSPSEQRKYWEIMRAQMSTYELLLMFYHAKVRTDFFDMKILQDVNYFQYLEASSLLNCSSKTSNRN